MRWMMTAVVFLGSMATLSADTFVYVSMGPEQKIQIYRLDSRDGKLTPVEAVAVEAAPAALAVDPQRKYLFASLRSKDSLASFRIDPATGKLKQLSTAALPKGESATFVGTDRTGGWLLSASYRGAKVVVHRLHDDASTQPLRMRTA